MNELTRKFSLVSALLVSAVAFLPCVQAAEPAKVSFTKADLATANGSARIGLASGNLACILTSIETRTQLEPDRWDSDAEAASWTTWLTAFDDNLIAKWFKNAPANGQETVGIRINPDSTINITNNTFFPGADATATAQATFETAISDSLTATMKMAKPMPPTKNKLKELHMSLTFMREPKAVPRYGRNEYGYVAVLGDKDYVTVYERTSSDGRFPGIQILTDDGKVVPLEQKDFDQKAAEIDSSGTPGSAKPDPAAPDSQKNDSAQSDPAKKD